MQTTHGGTISGFFTKAIRPPEEARIPGFCVLWPKALETAPRAHYSEIMRVSPLLALAPMIPLLGGAFLCPKADPAKEAADIDSSALLGLWLKAGPKKGDELRFYYFHQGGIGLYRYGRRGLNNTHSYDWKLESGQLVLNFRKTGEQQRVKLALREKDGARLMVLKNDPREPTPTAYRWVDSLSAMELLDASFADHEASDHPFARMWTLRENYATGGYGFAIYQLQAPAIDGRGVGWYHQGDFDNWSTEVLDYRRTKDQLVLHFPMRKERRAIKIRLGKSEDGKSTLRLKNDPRDFFQTRTFIDAGPSFGGLIEMHARSFSEGSCDH